ncbi:hypothetical protein KR026_009943 [Drosophila bipectinata]|nr:hypothetical protein KR026_009943 [Drosophila bipectinata]
MSYYEFGICPYNPDHRIMLFRMPGHIVKCKKNYRGPPLQICKYNATHRVLDMEEHLKECTYYRNYIDTQAVRMALTVRKAPTEDEDDVDNTEL